MIYNIGNPPVGRIDCIGGYRSILSAGGPFMHIRSQEILMSLTYLSVFFGLLCSSVSIGYSSGTSEEEIRLCRLWLKRTILVAIAGLISLYFNI
jgi:hypothetical protein